MSNQDDLGRPLPGAKYVSLPGVNKDNHISEAFRTALKEFFRHHPDLLSNPKMIELLKYCYVHYVNFNPQFRDLSINEKLEEASRMASDFWGSMSKA